MQPTSPLKGGGGREKRDPTRALKSKRRSCLLCNEAACAVLYRKGKLHIAKREKVFLCPALSVQLGFRCRAQFLALSWHRVGCKSSDHMPWPPRAELCLERRFTWTQLSTPGISSVYISCLPGSFKRLGQPAPLL